MLDLRDVAKTNVQARDRYLAVLTQALCCVTPYVQWRVGPVAHRGDTMLLATTESPLMLRTTAGKRYFLEASQWFHYADNPKGGKKVVTDRYVYTLSENELLSSELVNWHWHPQAPDPYHRLPHMHIGHGHEALKAYSSWHLPTSRVSFEAIVYFLIRDLAVSPARQDWEETLSDCLERFNTHKTW